MRLYIYTDGSALDNGSAGAGFYYEYLFEGTFVAGLSHTTNFDAEIEAVRRAICLLTNLSTLDRQAVFCVQSSFSASDAIATQ
ncbi:hypothetical protein TNCV_2211791 [Trichonephila clavipes]|nr:hypothetical protein TNCV_2211791 [Trichonephila clavipes]